MAKMLPPFVFEQTSSRAERKVFKMFCEDTATKSWTVLHSLALSEDKSIRPYGEIDFVVLVPGFGIVCLEVKGGGIKTIDGVWFTTGADGVEKALKRSPFTQARESMFMLRKHLGDKGGQKSGLMHYQTCYIVIFPDCLCPSLSPEFTRSEVIDSTDLRSGIGAAVTRCITQRKLIGTTFAHADLKLARESLRPDFDRAVLFTNVLKDSEERIAAFTEEQLQRLEELEENNRCLFDGPAGTGKTALAIHYAKRLASEGKATLLICFNRLLGKWITAQTKDIELLKAGSFWSIMSQLVQKSEFQVEFSQRDSGIEDHKKFELLGEYARLALLEFGLTFDAIVIDEAQDLAREPFLSLVNDLLIGGLQNGHWAMFGDFSQQVLFGTAGGVDFVRERCNSFTYSKLRRNCRNTKQIASAALNLTELPSNLYRGNFSEGPETLFQFYRSTHEQQTLINSCVEKLLKSGILVSDIIVLSANKFSNSGLATETTIAGYPIVDITQSEDPLRSGQFIRFSTVAAYKGLESSIAIVIDVQQLVSENSDPLLYVALTRPRNFLLVICHEKIRELVLKRAEREH
ncbi:MAG: NERD domain-containing protein [Cyanobacteria bacterium SZAS-4]|nr:NERD domain-containing protein [Cyanobacteria bacterium SZAS-4]